MDPQNVPPAKRRAWGPYATGLGIGLLEVFAMASAKRPLGVSSVFENAAAGALKVIAPEVEAHYEESGGTAPRLDWETALVGGVLAGAALSSTLSGDRDETPVPEVWSETVGTSLGSRYALAATGGALMMFGARLARGCTSGHGISGAMQLAASSWVFNPLMFASGAVTAMALFGRKHGT
jgi:hypothetical protein